MNIIIGVIMVAAALYLKLRYRPEGTLAKYLFGFTVLAGVVSMLTVESYANIWLMLWPVFDIVVSGLIVRCYYNEAVRQAEVREVRAEAQRRAAAERERKKAESARMRSRASVYAICRGESLAA